MDLSNILNNSNNNVSNECEIFELQTNTDWNKFKCNLNLSYGLDLEIPFLDETLNFDETLLTNVS